MKELEVPAYGTATGREWPAMKDGVIYKNTLN